MAVVIRTNINVIYKTHYTLAEKPMPQSLVSLYKHIYRLTENDKYNPINFQNNIANIKNLVIKQKTIYTTAIVIRIKGI